jgi:hypothetical protein
MSTAAIVDCLHRPSREDNYPQADATLTARAATAFAFTTIGQWYWSEQWK